MGALEELALERALEKLADESACEERALKGTREAQARHIAFKGLALGLRQRRSVGLGEPQIVA